jgi:hypothetical protein
VRTSSKAVTIQKANSNADVRTVGAVLNPTVPHTEADKKRILNAYYERPSIRGIQRVFGVTRPTLVDWLKKPLAPLP